MRSAPLDAETLEACIAAAVAAPSFFNAQPWRFRLDPQTLAFEVRAAPERSFNLRVAVSHFGWTPVVRLLPRPEDPGLLAVVRPTGALRRPTAEHRGDLSPAIWRRHSSRLPFIGRPLPPQARAELAEAAHTEGASLTFPEAAETARLLGVSAQAEQRNRADADRGAESRRWVRRGPDDTGLPQSALGPQDARERVPMRDFTAERLSAKDFEAAPAIALLRTEHDRRTDWLRAGEALEHVLLVATALGLRASLLHQPMEWPDLRRFLSPDPDHTGHPQMLIRLGYGSEGPATPHRAPRAVLDMEVPNRWPFPSAGGHCRPAATETASSFRSPNRAVGTSGWISKTPPRCVVRSMTRKWPSGFTSRSLPSWASTRFLARHSTRSPLQSMKVTGRRSSTRSGRRPAVRASIRAESGDAVRMSISPRTSTTVAPPTTRSVWQSSGLACFSAI